MLTAHHTAVASPKGATNQSTTINASAKPEHHKLQS